MKLDVSAFAVSCGVVWGAFRPSHVPGEYLSRIYHHSNGEHSGILLGSD